MPKVLDSPIRQKLLTFSRFIPRRNFPAQVAAKRGESNFARAFERAYLRQVGKTGLGGTEFGLADFGIADFIWISWRPENASSVSALALEQRLKKQKLYAFELKITNWRKGLNQAFRYGYFSDQAILVLPPQAAKNAKAKIQYFKELHVGLWLFDQKQHIIRKIYTPRSKARSPLAKEKAIQAILAKVKFSKFRK